MSDIGMVLEKAKKGARSSDDEEDDEVTDDASEDEVDAFREYQDASGAEGKAAALKRFIKLCGGY